MDSRTVDKLVLQVMQLKDDCPENIAIQCFDEDYFSTLDSDQQQRLLKCLNSGIENPDSEMGCYACQPSDYDEFKPFFSAVLSRHHKVGIDAEHKNDWDLSGVAGLPDDGNLDISRLGLPALSMRVRAGRNLKDFPLPGSMSREDRIRLEERMLQAFKTLTSDSDYGGGYYSLTPGSDHLIDQTQYQSLVDEHIMFKSMDDDSYLQAAGIAADWPYGRGCYVSHDRGIIIWVGEEDHLRIMCMAHGTLLNSVFDRLKTALDGVENIAGLEFAYSDHYGVVTSCPTNLGTGMRASVHIPLPGLTSDGTAVKAKAIARPLGLSVRGVGGEHTPVGKDGTVDVSPSARFCITEAEIITALYKGLSQLQLEENKSVQHVN